MNYLHIEKCSQLNQPGLSCVLFVSGCEHKCRQCQNAFSQNPALGLPFDENAKQEIFAELSHDWCSGLTFSGGDPLFIDNRVEVIAFAKEVREKFPNKKIWCYTGYTYEQVLNDQSMCEILKYIDVLVDGKFDYSKKDVNYHWAGSTNQRVIDIKNTFYDDIVLFNS